jgi:uncharacterized protein
MGFKEITINLPAEYSEKKIEDVICKKLRIRSFTYQIENKSLDARRRDNIHWQVKLSVISKEIKGKNPSPKPNLSIEYKKQNKKICLIGSGPAGFFSAFVLQKAGFETVLIERGTDVKNRTAGIERFETTGVFDSKSNYAFGEGGAGTFSDGKLTSRTKRIAKEKNFILSSYVNAGAPDEIKYLTHPHLGSDNLKIIVENLRKEYQSLGGKILFETQLEDIKVKNGKVIKAVTSVGDIEADKFIVAPGHSAFETYRMLMKNGVQFRIKNFALGCRVEHQQELINMAQWGTAQMRGVKAAEYRLTSKNEGNLPVYTFCMCPGGVIVPATAYSDTNIVNGMSLYQRDGQFANAACVAGLNLSEFLNKDVSASEALDWLENLERTFYQYSDGYKAPSCTITDFVNQKITNDVYESSYLPGLKQAPLWEMFPAKISKSLKLGLKDFSRKLNGFENGNIMGLESKTSSPIQVIRDQYGLCEGFENLYIVGEGSGYSGGIISSGVDGVKTAVSIIG